MGAKNSTENFYEAINQSTKNIMSSVVNTNKGECASTTDLSQEINFDGLKVSGGSTFNLGGSGERNAVTMKNKASVDFNCVSKSMTDNNVAQKIIDEMSTKLDQSNKTVGSTLSAMMPGSSTNSSNRTKVVNIINEVVKNNITNENINSCGSSLALKQLMSFKNVNISDQSIVNFKNVTMDQVGDQVVSCAMEQGIISKMETELRTKLDNEVAQGNINKGDISALGDAISDVTKSFFDGMNTMTFIIIVAVLIGVLGLAWFLLDLLKTDAGQNALTIAAETGSEIAKAKANPMGQLQQSNPPAPNPTP